MKQLICAKCQSSLVKVGKKYVCSNEDCDFQDLSILNIWSKDINNSTALWDENIINKAPSIVAFEYEKLRRLFVSNSIYGVQLQIKDLLEVILKFPVLIIVAQAYQMEKKKDQYNDILYFLMGKDLSLGDWNQLAERILERELNRDNEIINILVDVINIYKEHKIPNWRNDYIGHGALKLDDNAVFQSGIRDLLKVIFDHFNRCENWYQNIIFKLSCKGKDYRLVGSVNARDLNFITGTPVISINDEDIVLDPFIQYVNKGVYFFDTYQANKSKAILINYPSGDKIKQNPTPICNIYESLKKKKSVYSADVSAEELIYLRTQSEMINRIAQPSNIVKFKFLEDKITEFMGENDKGILMLQMESGMGKTTFSKMVDELAYNKASFRDILCRGYYINSTFSYSPTTFITKITDCLRQVDRRGEVLDGQIPSVNLSSDNVKEDSSKLINTLFQSHKKYSSKENLLLVIDGLDEIASSSDLSIINLIPDPGMLDKGVYILLTSRTDEQITPHMNSLINSLHIDKKIVVRSGDIDYQNSLKEYIVKRTKASESEAYRMIEIANSKFINIDILIKTYVEIGFDKVDSITCIAEEKYLDLLENLYGEVYFSEMVKMLITLSLCPSAVSVKLLSKMCGEEKITFKHLCYIEELRPLLDIIRTTEGNNISIHRKEVIDLTKTKYTREYEKVILDLYEEIIPIIEESKGRAFSEFDLEFVLNSITALSSYNKEDVADKMGKNISILMESILLSLRNNKYKIRENLYHSYYSFFENISKLIEVYIINKAEIDIYYYLKLIESFSDVFIHTGDIRFTGEKVHDALDLITRYEIGVDAYLLTGVYNKLARVSSKLGYDQQAKSYFNKADEIANIIDEESPQDKFDEIIKFYNKAPRKIDEAIYYKNKGDVRAIEILDDLMEDIRSLENGDFKEDSLVLSIKFCCYEVYGNFYKKIHPTKAMNYMIKARDLLPKIRMHDEVVASSLESDLLLNIGQLYRNLNKHKEAMDCYDKSLRINMSLVESGTMLNNEEICKLLNSKGNIERDLENHIKSIEYYTQAIDYIYKCECEGKFISPELYGRSLVSRAHAYEALGQYDNALKDYQKVSSLDIDFDKVKRTARVKS